MLSIKKISQLCITGPLCVCVPQNFHEKGPVLRKVFPWNDILINWTQQKIGFRSHIHVACIFIGNINLAWYSYLVRYLKEAAWHIYGYICVSNYAIIGSINGWSPVRRRAIIYSSVDLLLIESKNTNYVNFESKYQNFVSRKCIGKCRLQNGGHFVLTSIC